MASISDARVLGLNAGVSRMRAIQVVSLCSLMALPVAARGMQTTPQDPQGRDDEGHVRAYRASAGDGAIILDGILDEPVWSRADVIDEFRQREPDAGSPATERTEVRVVLSENTLHIGVIAFDSEPDLIVSRILQRDRIMSSGFFGGVSWGGDDGIAILFDAFHDHRNAVVFATNPNGAEFEALLTDEGQSVNISWRGVWEVAASRIPEGWSAEFSIPLRSLRYPDDSAGEPWGFNVYRMIRRRNEEALWRSWSREGNQGFHRVSLAGHIDGLTDLPRPGLNIEAKPFILAGGSQVVAEDGDAPADGELDLGLDIKVELRPGLLLDLTTNTDFAQVEVDDEQVNLTRFDLFFPEKRDFFLENAGIFDLGIPGFFGPPPIFLFFSRRIGFAAGGEVPILAGSRITGRVGNQTVGFLNVVTGETDAAQRESFTVARVKRDMGDRDFLGFMITDRRGLGSAPTGAALAGPGNTGLGIDGSYWLTPRLQFTGFAIRSITEGEGGDDNAFRASLDFTADRHGFFVQHMEIQPELRTELGFTLRTDIRQEQLFLRYSPRPQVLGLRKIDIRLNGLYQTRTDGAFQDWNAGLSLVPLWNSGDQFSVTVGPGRTQVDEAFTLSGVAPVPAGRFDAGSIQWNGSTTTSRPVSVSHFGQVRQFFGGTLVALGGGVRIAPTPSVDLNVGFTRNDVDVPDGEFTANLGSARLTYAFSTKLITNLLVQYNSLSDTFSTNVRVNFIHRPGSDLFVVFTEARGSEDSLWDLSDRGFVTKLTFLQRF